MGHRDAAQPNIKARLAIVNHQTLSSFIWSVADLLRGDYKQSDYGKVILPFTVLRRLDCVLEPTKAKVLAEYAAKKKAGLNPDPFLLRASGQSFYNTSDIDLHKLMGDQDHISQNLYAYIQGFSPAVRDIFERFSFSTQIDKLAKSGLLYLVTEKFAGIDLHPEAVDNHEMGLAFEELIRKFAELSNETAGEHFTPREVIRLMVNLLFVEDDNVLSKPGVVRTIYDPTAGTGGMLSVAGEHLAALNPQARLTMFGQELNDESYAICKADMLIKGQDVANIVAGNTLSEDGHAHAKFDYMLSNPPFGVEWKKVEKEVRKEHESQGFNGRFGPACRAYRMARCCFSCISSPRCARPRMAAAASALCTMARRCLLVARGPARAKSAATCWRTIWSRPSSVCRRICSTTPAFLPMFGSFPIVSRMPAGARCS
jgi:type I restriction enzyme M protein